MTTTHTPGPWTNRHANQHGQLVIGSPNWTSMATGDHMVRVECRRVHDEILGVHVDAACVEEAEANARLISAAPDLLSALKALLAYANTYSDTMCQIGRGAEQLGSLADSESVAGIARSAILRAEGVTK